MSTSHCSGPSVTDSMGGKIFYFNPTWTLMILRWGERVHCLVLADREVWAMGIGVERAIVCLNLRPPTHLPSMRGPHFCQGLLLVSEVVALVAIKTPLHPNMMSSLSASCTDRVHWAEARCSEWHPLWQLVHGGHRVFVHGHLPDGGAARWAGLSSCNLYIRKCHPAEL